MDIKIDQKKTNFPVKKLCILFSDTTEKNRPQITTYDGPQGFFRQYLCKLKIIFLQELRVRL